MQFRLAPGLALTGLCAALFLSPAAPAMARLPGRPAVIVQDFHNRSYEVKFDWVGTGLAYTVRKNLSLMGALEMLEDRKAKSEDPEPVADYVIEGEVRLDEAESRDEPKFVVFVTLDKVAEAGNRRQFLTEGTPGQLFEIGSYLTERIASYLNIDVPEDVRTRFGRGMTQNLTAYQLFCEAILERRIHAKLDGYDKATTLDPKFAEAYFHRARVDMVLREYGRADAALRRTIELVPDFAPAHNDLAYILAQQNKLGEAEAAYRAAIKADPGDPRYRVNLGTLLAAAGKLEPAHDEYTAALKLAPGDPETLRALQVVSVKLGRAPAESLVARAAPVPMPTPASTPVPATGRKPSPTPAPTRIAAAATPPPVTGPRPTAPPTATPVAAASSVPPKPSPGASRPPATTAQATPAAAVSATPAAVRASDSANVADRGLADELDRARIALIRSRGDRAAGEQALSQATAAAAAGDRVQAWLALGRLWLGEKANYAAVDALRAAVDAAPANAEARESLAIAYERIGKKGAAEKERAAIAAGGR